MIYKFRIISEEVSNFKLEIQADADSTFLSLRNAILDAVGYSKDQLDSFIICDDEWRKEKEITLADMDSDSDEDIWLMDETRLSDLIEDEGQKLAFVFDNLANRCFFMDMKRLFSAKICRSRCAHVKKVVHQNKHKTLTLSHNRSRQTPQPPTSKISAKTSMVQIHTTKTNLTKAVTMRLYRYFTFILTKQAPTA